MRDHVLTSVTFDCAETVQECAFKKSDTLTGIDLIAASTHARASVLRVIRSRGTAFFTLIFMPSEAIAEP
jgi:hypothetical protein